MNRKLPPILVSTVLLAVIVSAFAGASAVDVAALQEDPPPAQEERCAVSDADLAIDSEEQAAIDLINSQRAAAGLPALTVSSSLMRPATWKARSMADGAPHEHDDPFRTTAERLMECGASPDGVSEMLGAGGAVATAASVVQMWYDDPPHREIMLNPDVRTIGIGHADDGRGTYFWCALVGPAGD